MAVTTLTGLIDTTDVLSNEIAVDMEPMIAMLDTDTSMFTTMLQKLNQRPATSTKVEWLEDQYFPQVSTIATGGVTNVATTLNVNPGDGQIFRVGDVIRITTTGEGLLVTAISTDALTVTRGYGAVGGTAASAGDQILIIGSANKEGASLPSQKVTLKVAAFNYCQIFRNSYTFTNTEVAVQNVYAGSAIDYQRKKAGVEHKRDIEKGLFFGPRKLDSSASEPRRTMGGLVEYIATNVFNAGGTLTSANMEVYMRNALTHGDPASKVIFASPVAASALSGFLRSAYAPVTTETKLWGAQVTALVNGSYGNQLPVFVKRDWANFATASNQYGSFLFIVDMSFVKLRPLRTTRLLGNRQAPDADATTEEYLTEISVEIQQEAAHALVKGITG